MVPPFHTPKWSFVVGKNPWLLGKPTIWGNIPIYIYISKNQQISYRYGQRNPHLSAIFVEAKPQRLRSLLKRRQEKRGERLEAAKKVTQAVRGMQCLGGLLLLFVVCCLLSVVGCWLLFVVGCRLLFVVCCRLSVGGCCCCCCCCGGGGGGGGGSTTRKHGMVLYFLLPDKCSCRREAFAWRSCGCRYMKKNPLRTLAQARKNSA